LPHATIEIVNEISDFKVILRAMFPEIMKTVIIRVNCNMAFVFCFQNSWNRRWFAWNPSRNHENHEDRSELQHGIRVLLPEFVKLMMTCMKSFQKSWYR